MDRRLRDIDDLQGSAGIDRDRERPVLALLFQRPSRHLFPRSERPDAWDLSGKFLARTHQPDRMCSLGKAAGTWAAIPSPVLGADGAHGSSRLSRNLAWDITWTPHKCTEQGSLMVEAWGVHEGEQSMVANPLRASGDHHFRGGRATV